MEVLRLEELNGKNNDSGFCVNQISIIGCTAFLHTISTVASVAYCILFS